MILVKDQRDQGNKIVQKTDPHKYIQLIFDKGEKVIQWQKKYSSAYGAETGHPRAGWGKKTNLDTDLTLFTK